MVSRSGEVILGAAEISQGEFVGEGKGDGAGRGIGAFFGGMKSLKWAGNRRARPDRVEGIFRFSCSLEADPLAVALQSKV